MMASGWESVLRRPEGFADGPIADNWFAQIANQLLNGSRVVVGNAAHRLVEIEFYYHGDQHPDPFTHRDPLQLQSGRWYFHRTHGTYRSGTFKGLDLTFGDGKAFGGVLIRSIETSDGTLIDGPSLRVDHLLASAGYGTVAALDGAVGGRQAWDPESPLALTVLDAVEQHPITRSARVGLSVKKLRPTPDATRYIMRPYRFLTEPRRVSKGKLHVVLALYTQGASPDRIRDLTGCPRQSIQRYIEDFEEGRKAEDFSSYFGIILIREVCAG